MAALEKFRRSQKHAREQKTESDVIGNVQSVVPDHAQCGVLARYQCDRTPCPSPRYEKGREIKPRLPRTPTAQRNYFAFAVAAALRRATGSSSKTGEYERPTHTLFGAVKARRPPTKPFAFLYRKTWRRLGAPILPGSGQHQSLGLRTVGPCRPRRATIQQKNEICRSRREKMFR